MGQEENQRSREGTDCENYRRASPGISEGFLLLFKLLLISSDKCQMQICTCQSHPAPSGRRDTTQPAHSSEYDKQTIQYLASRLPSPHNQCKGKMTPFEGCIQHPIAL
ncbi:hypothetical protein AMECASPLE_025155 [Ameca splendens]|uniref:Uncharacterized protein n=1 Tax=Ameca splendens TaxID=208324 RepID=A0ABV0XHP0_9TELE